MAYIDNLMVEESILSSNSAVVANKPSNYRLPKDIEKIFIATIPVSILAFIANAIVFWLFCYKIKHTNLTPYFLNLTIANLLTSCCSAEVAILDAANLRLVSAFQHLVQMLYMCAYDTNLYIFTALTVERYITVYFPVWWQHRRPAYFSVILCVILWVLSCNLSLLYFFSCFPKFLITNEEFENKCGPSSIISLITEVAIVPSSVFCFSLAIWIRTSRSQQKPRARLDITIVTVASVILMFNVPTRAAFALSFWIEIDLNRLNVFTVLLDSLCCSVIPIVYLTVGCWKRWEALKSFQMLLEGALEDTENMPESPKTDEEQA